ncbi:MAG: PrsW family intramembrane metalloprotease [Clostridia bacterium]|nr:PrsW family intramembrane metalloprotease [Clostridia bacterium]
MLFYLFPYYLPSVILIAAAVIPAVALLYYVYRADTVEKEPPLLLLRLALLGILSTAAAKLLEYAGVFILNAVFRRESFLYLALLYFGVVGFAEEGSKYALLKRATWNSPHFNCRFDGVVYSVFVSLGFALWENIGYVLANGFGTALIRALTAVPGHACFGVFMGCWYSQARWLENRGDAAAAHSMRVLTVVLPALLHGAYDFLASATPRISPWYFVLFVVAMFLVTVRLVYRLSRNDEYI